MKITLVARISYFHRIDVHALQHFWVLITAYIQHNVLLVASLELIDDVKVKKRFRDERLHHLARLPRDHVDESLIMNIDLNNDLTCLIM